MPKPVGITAQEFIDAMNILRRESTIIRAVDFVEVSLESGAVNISGQLVAIALNQFIAPRIFDYR